MPSLRYRGRAGRLRSADDLPTAAPRALPAPDDGLRILASKDESLENVIHGVWIGTGDDEPDLVARVEMETAPTDMVAGANATDDETEGFQSEEERQELEQLRVLWLLLLEREQRLQELEGLREQEAAVWEFENRVSAAAMVARLLELKLSTLQEENARLRAQVDELDAARAELVRHQGAGAGRAGGGAALRARMAKLERGGEERASALAAEAAALRKANAALEELILFLSGFVIYRGAWGLSGISVAAWS